MIDKDQIFFDFSPMKLIFQKLKSRRFVSTLSRNTKYKKLTTKDVQYFSSFLENSQIIQNQDDLESFNTDWLHQYKGNSQIVLRPKTTEQVSQILKYCNENLLAVVPQGGNTGLVGGSVPVYDEIIVSTSLMNKIISFHENGSLICQSGMVLEKLDEYLENKGFMMPLDLGAKGSCQIGGNLATNAGGLRYLRYKSLHANVMGLEVVLPDGSIMDNIKVVRKDNTGLHLDHLFIGSEGTLGLITKVALQVPVRPKSINVCLFGTSSFENCVEIFKSAKKSLNQILSAFEFFDETCLTQVLENAQGIVYPLEKKHNFYVVLETHGNDSVADDNTISEFCEDLLQRELANDGTIAADETQFKHIWKLRESITEATAKAGAIYKYDISIPQDKMYDIVNVFKKKFENTEIIPLGFGHMGDDNLHLNFLVKGKKKDPEIVKLIEPFVYEWISSHNGSISAEHGLGLMKSEHLHFSKGPKAIELMKGIKKLFDPNEIMNPYKYYPK